MALACAWCFSKVDFARFFLSILVDSLSILDYSFFNFAVKRKKATLRTGARSWIRQSGASKILIAL